MIEFDECLVEIAPAPALRRIVTFNDRMPTRLIVCRCVLARRFVATTDVPARTAKAQMDPPVAGLQAFLAASRTWSDFPDEATMVTRSRH